MNLCFLLLRSVSEESKIEKYLFSFKSRRIPITRPRFLLVFLFSFFVFLSMTIKVN